MTSFWDLAYANGDHIEHWESPRTPVELAAAVAAGLVPEEAIALDVGCGAGAEAIFLASLGYRVIGVDTSAVALEIARGRATEAGVDVDFRCAAASDLPIPDGSVGFAYDRGCLHLIESEERSHYARELHRVLRDGATSLLCGAAESDEEEGVVAIDAHEIDRWFLPLGFTRGPIVPIELEALSGSLPANLLMLRREASPPQSR